MLDACNDMNGIFKYLTYKKVEMKECILTTGTTDALVLKKQTINIESGDQYPLQETSFKPIY